MTASPENTTSPVNSASPESLGETDGSATSASDAPSGGIPVCPASDAPSGGIPACPASDAPSTEDLMGFSYAEAAVGSFGNFVNTIAALRAPDGCPWDREQTHASIAKNMIEEAYEAVDTIEHEDWPHLQEELGDVLLQVVLQSQIAADAGEFTIADVIADIDAKIIRRHPHVFGDAAAGSASEVLDVWDAIKLQEQKDKQQVNTTDSANTTVEPEQTLEQPESLLDSVPIHLPALMQAQKISRKAVSAGFEWEQLGDVWQKVYEEIDELKEAYAAAPKEPNGKLVPSEGEQEALMELGDVFFTLTNVARKMGLDAESALRATCNKFRERWSFMEGAAWAQGKRLEDLPVEEQEELWQQAKAHLRLQ